MADEQETFIIAFTMYLLILLLLFYWCRGFATYMPPHLAEEKKKQQQQQHVLLLLTLPHILLHFIANFLCKIFVSLFFRYHHIYSHSLVPFGTVYYHHCQNFQIDRIHSLTHTLLVTVSLTDKNIHMYMYIVTNTCLRIICTQIQMCVSPPAQYKRARQLVCVRACVSTNVSERLPFLCTFQFY